MPEPEGMFDISRAPRIRYADLCNSRYDMLNRALERARIDLAQGVDAHVLGMFWKALPQKHEDN
jgi:hypothetical protein